MNLWRVCLAICVLQLSVAAFGQDEELIEPEMGDEAPIAASADDRTARDDSDASDDSFDERDDLDEMDPCLGRDDCDALDGCGAMDGCVSPYYSFVPGWFAGLGGSFNSVRVDGTLGGTATTDVYNGSTLVATGAAGGPAPPTDDTLTTFAPVAQLGYFHNLCQSEWFWGSKLTYKYLGLTFSNQNIDSPQTGSFTTTSNPPTTTPFTGNAIALSSQTSVNHQLALMPCLGHDFGRGRFYVGGGPVAFETQTRVYGLSSYADINGQSTNIGGAPLNLASNTWMWGGAWQMGLVYYLRPLCFVDVGYDFMVTGNYTEIYPTPTTSVSGNNTYVSLIDYSTSQRVWSQGINVTLNWTF